MGVGLSGLAGIDGFMRGYSMMQGIEDNKLRREEMAEAREERRSQMQRAAEAHQLQMEEMKQRKEMNNLNMTNSTEDRKLRREEMEDNRRYRNSQLGMAAESHRAQMANAKQASQINAFRLQDMDDEKQEKMAKAMARAMHAGHSSKLSAEDQQLITAHPNLDPQRLLGADMREAVAIGEKAFSGKIDYSAPEVGRAMDMLFPEIALGAKDGRKVRVSRVYPGKEPGTVMIGLNVEGDDQERPLTDGRSNRSDDTVKVVKLDTLLNRLTTTKQAQEFFSKREGREWFMKKHLGDELAKASKTPLEKDAEDFADRMVSAEAKQSIGDYDPASSWQKHRDKYARTGGLKNPDPAPEPTPEPNKTAEGATSSPPEGKGKAKLDPQEKASWQKLWEPAP